MSEKTQCRACGTEFRADSTLLDEHGFCVSRECSDLHEATRRAERARIVAIAREMAVEYDKATGEGLDNAANALKWARGAAARDALLALVGRIDR